MKAVLCLAALIFLICCQLKAQSREAGTDVAAIKQHMRNRDTNIVSPKNKNAEAIKLALKQYCNAIEKLDMTGTDKIFTDDSKIYESGAFEGNYLHFMESHLKPELKFFKSFTFSDYNADVTIAGTFAIETYNCTIVIATDNSEVKRKGVTTSVLKKVKGDWKIIEYHNSNSKI